MKFINWGLNLPPILRKVSAMGYKTFESGDFDLNLIGLRSKSRRPGLFDDEFRVCYKDGFDWIEERYVCTTDPSMEQHLNPDNKKGVAILKAGQYRGVYQLDMHRGSYEALCQRGGEVAVYRDNNRDDRSDHINEESGYFGINIHRAHNKKIVSSTQYYSHGCQVIQNPADFARLIALAKLQIGQGYKTFTYTLIEIDFKELE